MRAYITSIFCIISSLDVNAQPMDCEKIKSSKMPYELVYSSSKVVDGKSYPSGLPDGRRQTYRNPRNTTIIYSLLESKNSYMKSEYVSGMISRFRYKSPPDDNRKVYYYDPPLNENIMSAGRSYDGKLKIGDITSNNPEIFTYYTIKSSKVGTRSITIGPCIFDTIAYTTILESSTPETTPSVTTTTYYSPEMGASLADRSVVSMGKNARGETWETEGKSINLNFSPVSD